MLNLPRIRMVQAVNAARGQMLAKMGQLPLSYFDALAMSREEAESQMADHNTRQVIAEMQAQARKGAF